MNTKDTTRFQKIKMAVQTNIIAIHMEGIHNKPHNRNQKHFQTTNQNQKLQNKKDVTNSIQYKIISILIWSSLSLIFLYLQQHQTTYQIQHENNKVFRKTSTSDISLQIMFGSIISPLEALLYITMNLLAIEL